LWTFTLVLILSSAGYLSCASDSYLTSLAVTPSVTRGRAKMQKTVTTSLTRSTDCETDGHAMVIAVALRCGESVVNWPFAATYQLLGTLRAMDT